MAKTGKARVFDAATRLGYTIRRADDEGLRFYLQKGERRVWVKFSSRNAVVIAAGPDGSWLLSQGTQRADRLIELLEA